MVDYLFDSIYYIPYSVAREVVGEFDDGEGGGTYTRDNREAGRPG